MVLFVYARGLSLMVFDVPVSIASVTESFFFRAVIAELMGTEPSAPLALVPESILIPAEIDGNPVHIYERIADVQRCCKRQEDSEPSADGKLSHLLAIYTVRACESCCCKLCRKRKLSPSIAKM